MVAYQGYRHAFAKEARNPDYEKHLSESIHKQNPNTAFL